MRYWDGPAVDECERLMAYWDEQDAAWRDILRAQLEAWTRERVAYEHVSLQLTLATHAGREGQAKTLSERRMRHLDTLQRMAHEYATTLQRKGNDNVRAHASIRFIGYETE